MLVAKFANEEEDRFDVEEGRDDPPPSFRRGFLIVLYPLSLLFMRKFLMFFFSKLIRQPLQVFSSCEWAEFFFLCQYFYCHVVDGVREHHVYR